MTVLLMFAILLVLGVAAARFGADTRTSREWARTDPALELVPTGQGSRP